MNDEYEHMMFTGMVVALVVVVALLAIMYAMDQGAI